VLQPNWISLANGNSGGYELHIKPEIDDLARLKPIVEKRNLALKKVNGSMIIHG
jgi:hypothetical protein